MQWNAHTFVEDLKSDTCVNTLLIDGTLNPTMHTLDDGASPLLSLLPLLGAKEKKQVNSIAATNEILLKVHRHDTIPPLTHSFNFSSLFRNKILL